ncbi:MAG: LysR family transcriptional regulator [Roseovarius sp.]|nr:LysR family transcriptional regulator [Roseovarius sp.]
MIKLEALRVFVTVAEIGNIRDAADRLGRTPSAISMALKQLEEEIGADLFETERKNALSAVGRYVLETARIQILGFDRAISAIRAYAHNRIGKLAVACVPSVAASLMPGLLEQFIAQRPGVEVELFDIDTASVAALVELGQVDLGIAGRPRTRGTLECTPLFSDRFIVVCGADAPLAHLGRPVEWSDLEGERIIRNGASQTINAAEYKALAERAPLMVRNVTSLIAMAGSGLGVTLLPALSAARLPEGVVACDLADREAVREVVVLEQKGRSRSPVASAFIALIAEECARANPVLGLSPPPARSGA